MPNQPRLSDDIPVNNSQATDENKKGASEQAVNSGLEIDSRAANVDFGAQPELARDLVEEVRSPVQRFQYSGDLAAHTVVIGNFAMHLFPTMHDGGMVSSTKLHANLK